ncbi:28573_t:CDS:2, partial [Dentiscutata erythropus]
LIDMDDVCQVVVKVKGKEQKCGMEYTHDGSTSNMIAHLRSVYNIVDDNHLLIFESIDTEVYSEDEEPGEVDNGNLIEQPN